MKTIEQIKERHEAELREAIAREQIAVILPRESTQIHVYKDHISVVYSREYRNQYKFREAYDIFKLFTPVAAEHWKSGCISVRPLEINEYAKEKSATLQGASIAEVKLSAGKGYDSHALTFWARIGETLLHVSIDLQVPSKWLPQTQFRYDIHGHCTSSRVTPACIGEDQRRQFWSPEGSYQLSYYWADPANFEAFSSTVND